MVIHVKQRRAAAPGTIPDRLQMFSREVRFYREVAPHLGVRVPHCFRADIDPDGSTVLELEDLSSWAYGADVEAAARHLNDLHSRWSGTAVETWPWIVRNDASDLVEVLFEETWPSVRARRDMTDRARRLGDKLVGRVAEAERAAERAGSPTLTHGDASFNNMRTSPSGEIALLDWEDFGLGPGASEWPGFWSRQQSHNNGTPRSTPTDRQRPSSLPSQRPQSKPSCLSAPRKRPVRTLPRGSQTSKRQNVGCDGMAP